MKSNIYLTSNGIIGTKFLENFIEENIINKNIIVIDNGTYGTGNYNDRENNVQKFYEYGAKKVDLITVTNENVDIIFNYDVCYMMGGSISNLVSFIQTVNFKEKLINFLEAGIYIGESAGSIILDKDVEWYFNLKRGTKPKYDVIFDSYKGLGIIDEHIYPHYNKEKYDSISKITNYPEKIHLLNDGEYIEKSRKRGTSVKYSYKTKNVCPIKIDIEIEHSKVKNIEFIGGGCKGNLSALKKLIIGMDVDHAIELFKGNVCGNRGTSCMDQFSLALEKAKTES